MAMTKSTIPWHTLVEPLTRKEISTYTKDEGWQWFKSLMNSYPLDQRFDWCLYWLHKQKHSRASVVQVANYVNALKRGGLIRG